MRPKFYIIQDVLRTFRPDWIGKEIRIVGFLQRKRNFVFGFDHVVEVDGQLYDARGLPLGKKRLTNEPASGEGWTLKDWPKE